MFVMHIALQGCLRAHDVEYGITADTGGHIRYLLELVQASSRARDIERIDVITRAFDTDFSRGDYRQSCEFLNPKVRIVRLATVSSDYLPKEALAGELPSFVDALVAYIDGLERPPDMLHAHYADAAEVAGRVRRRLGIPFVFTGHSLGQAKLAYAGSDAIPCEAMKRRIAFEDRALREASLVIASSRDEAELQYADYPAYEPGAIRVIRPGSDLDAFAEAHATPDVERMLSRFLCEPDKPALLAIARPVTRKNLSNLVRAYGESPALQQQANLVILAGGRESLDDLEPELADNLREMLALIDHYDLYGRVAYPKRHRMADVPAVYAWARDRGGVFANVAFNEPFGLTLLEAAAAGLPVIATDSGGPNEIIERCDNGVLVNPCETGAISNAAFALMGDRARWRRYQANGRAGVAAFDWSRHVDTYHRLLGALCGSPRAERSNPPAALLACDIDGTLVGCERGVQAFKRWQPVQGAMMFGVATGRSLHSALDVLAHAGLGAPEFLVTSVGAEIHVRARDGVRYRRDREWQAHIDAGWSRTAIVEALSTVPGLVMQGVLEQREHKVSYLCEPGRRVVPELRAALTAAGLDATIVHSQGRCVDVLPPRASKGAAVEHLRARFDVPRASVYVAGDSGNDIEMLESVGCSIIVANHRDGIADRRSLAHAYRARAGHACGVIEGVEHFRTAASNVS